MSEHPFAQYIRTLGKGRKGARALSQDEARTAMEMIFQQKVEPEQVGAFLMLMRVKEETAEEVAGFVEGIRATLPQADLASKVAIDWPAYAGKKRQLPWFLLAALILGRNGYPVLMHGMSREDERVYAPAALKALGIDTSTSLQDAAVMAENNGLAYLPIEDLSNQVQELIDIRHLLGLRTPLHTVARMLNPCDAKLIVQGIFHPNYAPVHHQTALLLGQNNSLVFKGEGGEAERIPDRNCYIYGITNGEAWEEDWQSDEPTGRFVRNEALDLEHFRAVWEGREEDAYGDCAVIGTLAIVLRALGHVSDRKQAYELATQWWTSRAEIQ